jgi:hypothetical protein
LSVDACHDNVADVWRTPLAASPVGLEGGCVSEQAAVCATIVTTGETLPAASAAATPSV